MAGKLFLIPTPLGGPASTVLPDSILETVLPLRVFAVENLRTARRFLRDLIPGFPIDECRFFILDEHSPSSVLPDMLGPILEGQDLGLMSEAGCPATADPGAALVALAHQNDIQVIPLVGPSSIILALMASGLNGQQFAFAGYLPAKTNELGPAIRKAEARALVENQTQIFIETPYRNLALLAAFLEHLRPTTKLCIATDLTLESEWVKTYPVAKWKTQPAPNLHKHPTVFLIG